MKVSLLQYVLKKKHNWRCSILPHLECGRTYRQIGSYLQKIRWCITSLKVQTRHLSRKQLRSKGNLSRLLVATNRRCRRFGGRLRVNHLSLKARQEQESRKLLRIWSQLVWLRGSEFSSSRKSKWLLMRCQQNSRRLV